MTSGQDLEDRNRNDSYAVPIGVKKIILRRRLAVIGSIFPALLGVLLQYAVNSRAFEIAMFSIGSEGSTRQLYTLLVYFSFFLFLVAFASLALLYLQTGFRSSAETEKSTAGHGSRKLEETARFYSEGEVASSYMPHATTRTSEIVDDFGNIITTELREGQRSALNSQTQSSNPSLDGSALKDRLVGQQFFQSRERLLREIASLGWRGNVNLVLGILVSVSGLSVLAIFLLSENSHLVVTAGVGSNVNIQTAVKQTDEAISFFVHFLPRLTFVLLIELFAYFFLKLYKNSLAEIKYFQNEITNIEAKHLALRAAFLAGSAALSNKVIGSLVDTERNHILEKGQTTVELERSKIDTEGLSTLMKNVSLIFEAVKKSHK